MRQLEVGTKPRLATRIRIPTVIVGAPDTRRQRMRLYAGREAASVRHLGLLMS